LGPSDYETAEFGGYPLDIFFLWIPGGFDLPFMWLTTWPRGIDGTFVVNLDLCCEET
jgi:hypothetical protein